MQLKGFFPKQAAVSESRTIVVTADHTWPLTDDDAHLFDKLGKAVENQLAADEELSGSVLPAPAWFEIEGWRNAASEWTLLGLRPVGRGVWGHNYDTLRHCQRVEVKLTVHYSVAEYPSGDE